MSFSVCSKNGNIIPLSDAQIPVTNVEFAYGFGVYETIRVVNQKPRFIQDHILRLIESAKHINLDHGYKQEQIEKYITELIQQIEKETYNLKMLLIGARNPEDAQLYIIPLNPKFIDKKMYKHGIEVITKNYERLYPHAKTLNMLQSYMLYTQAQKENAYDALLLDDNNNIIEGTRTNFLAMKGRKVISPPEEKILPGITRKYVLKVAQENNFTVSEADIALSEIQSYDAAFLTSTSTKIVPITKIDNINIPISNHLKLLIHTFKKFHNS